MSKYSMKELVRTIENHRARMEATWIGPDEADAIIAKLKAGDAVSDLLKAAKNALELIVNIQSREEGPLSMPWIEEQELEAAIAKAEGREE